MSRVLKDVGELKTQICQEFQRMLARFQPPRSRLVSYQGADTTLSGFCAENYRLALRGRSRGKHMLSPVSFTTTKEDAKCIDQQCMVQIQCTHDTRCKSITQHSSSLQLEL